MFFWSPVELATVADCGLIELQNGRKLEPSHCSFGPLRVFSSSHCFLLFLEWGTTLTRRHNAFRTCMLSMYAYIFTRKSYLPMHDAQQGFLPAL